MSLRLTNTLSREKELFAPLDPMHVRLYVCGPTVYDRAHIGNARPVVVFDVLYRLLRRHYPRVTYVRNITDIDDKIMARAAERGVPISALTAGTEAEFRADMARLGALAPDAEPRATESIPEMVAMIAGLIARGFAYAADGHVLFHVPAMAEYGRLSRRNRDELIAGARVEVAPYKRDPADFVLWKPSAADQPGWDSPWGRGRPGWHIECSAMSWKLLGPVFDIHGGGLDLIFPHHENEIAQSRCFHGAPAMARVWMHNGFVTVNGEKMSKSLGNFFTVHDLLEAWPGEAIRLALLSAQYRQPLDFTTDGLAQAKAQLDRLYGALRGASVGGTAPETAAPDAAVLEALDDDLNTPAALMRLHELANAAYQGAAEAVPILAASAAALGLLEAAPEDWFKWRPPSAAGPTDAEIDDLIRRRREARKAKDFAEADRIRAMLSDRGVVLEDGPSGTTWRRGT